MSAKVDVAVVAEFLRKHDAPSYFALRTLDGLKRGQVDGHRADIFRFLVNRYGEIPLDRSVGGSAACGSFRPGSNR